MSRWTEVLKQHRVIISLTDEIQGMDWERLSGVLVLADANVAVG